MHLSGKTRTRLRRAALSPRMVGLITFSFSLVILGIIAYTASLPSLIQASQRSDEERLSHVVAQGLFGGDAMGKKGSADGDEAEDPSGESDEEEASDQQKGRVTLGGMTLQGVISGVANAPASKGGSSSTGSGGSAGGGSANGGGSDSSQSGTSTPDEPSIPEVPSEPPVTEEQEQQFYNALLAKVNLINGYVGEVNASTSAFNADCMADRATRERHLTEANSLTGRLFNEYLYVRDSILVTNDSRYKNAQGDLIRMYRLLTEYMMEVANAWELNVGEAPGDVNALLAQLQAAQNNQLAEFQQVYNGFVL